MLVTVGKFIVCLRFPGNRNDKEENHAIIIKQIFLCKFYFILFFYLFYVCIFVLLGDQGTCKSQLTSVVALNVLDLESQTTCACNSLQKKVSTHNC